MRKLSVREADFILWHDTKHKELIAKRITMPTEEEWVDYLVNRMNPEFLLKLEQNETIRNLIATYLADEEVIKRYEP